MEGGVELVPSATAAAQGPCFNSLYIDINKGLTDIPCMRLSSRLTRKNQTTVPKAVIDALGMKPSDRLVYEIEADRVILRARTGQLADLLREPPSLPPPKQPPTQGEIDTAIGRDLARSDTRIRRQWHRSRAKARR